MEQVRARLLNSWLAFLNQAMAIFTVSLLLILGNQSLSSPTASSGLKIGYCPQEHVFVNHLTLRENIELAVSLKLYTRDHINTESHEIGLYTDSLL